MNFGGVIYLLCTLTSVSVAWLLFRAYIKNRTPLLLWSTLCFVGLAMSNTFLFLDIVVTGPAISLMPLRLGLALASGLVMLYGMIWEIE